MGLDRRAPGLLALRAELKNVYMVISLAFGEAIGAADPLDVGSGPGRRGPLVRAPLSGSPGAPRLPADH